MGYWKHSQSPKTTHKNVWNFGAFIYSSSCPRAKSIIKVHALSVEEFTRPRTINQTQLPQALCSGSNALVQSCTLTEEWTDRHSLDIPALETDIYTVDGMDNAKVVRLNLGSPLWRAANLSCPSFCGCSWSCRRLVWVCWAPGVRWCHSDLTLLLLFSINDSFFGVLVCRKKRQHSLCRWQTSIIKTWVKWCNDTHTCVLKFAQR